MRRRDMLKYSTGTLLAGYLPYTSFGSPGNTVALSDIRTQVSAHFEDLLLGKPYGKYKTGTDASIDLYASCDIAIARHLMGENLINSLSSEKRQEWIGYINTFQEVADGSYDKRFNHSKLHANGMVIGALGVLGGKQKYNVRLYDDFNAVDKIIPWLEQIDWAKQWGASHQFWGGIHCYSMSNECTEEWLEIVFAWLNQNLDERTGWWRKGVQHTDRHQPLGGSVHILPIYEHHQRDFPFPKQVIDSVLNLQLPNGRWLSREKDRAHVMHYLELDALYALHYMSKLVPGYRDEEINEAVNRYGDLVVRYWENPTSNWKNQHPHRILSMVGTFGLLQQMMPDRFHDSVTWSDIFSDIRLYNTAAVEVL